MPANFNTKAQRPKDASNVAQIFNLPYRRIAFCGAFASATLPLGSEALPITNRRYGRVQLCATLVAASPDYNLGWNFC
jgi:hypothetical protein